MSFSSDYMSREIRAVVGVSHSFLRPMAPNAAASTTNRDSIRASVFDVCLELGALDENSLVAEWMFNDPSSDGTNAEDDRQTIRPESISMGWEDMGMVHDEKHHIPFSIRASAFAARLRSKSKSRRKPDVLTTNELTNHELGYISLSRRSFFQRTVRKSDAGLHPDQPVVQTPTDDGHVSTNPKSLFRRKARSAAEPPNAQKEFPMVPDPILKASPAAPTSDAAPQASSSKALPHVQIASDLDDDDWEEVEARPQSPLYALRNKGINPAPAVLTKKKHSGIPAKPSEDAERTKPHHHRLSFSLPRSIFLPSPSKRRKTTSHPVSPSPASRPRPNRRQLSVRTKALEPRGVSISLPSSPFLLVTSHDTSGDPNTLSTSVVVSPLNAPSPPPVFPVSVSKTRRMSMGYHNQFFPDTPSKSVHPKSASYPSLPQAITSQQGRQFPFPRMQ